MNWLKGVFLLAMAVPALSVGPTLATAQSPTTITPQLLQGVWKGMWSAKGATGPIEMIVSGTTTSFNVVDVDGTARHWNATLFIASDGSSVTARAQGFNRNDVYRLTSSAAGTLQLGGRYNVKGQPWGEVVMTKAPAGEAAAAEGQGFVGKWVWDTGDGDATLAITAIANNGDAQGTYTYRHYKSVFGDNATAAVSQSGGAPRLNITLESGSKFDLGRSGNQLIGTFLFSRDGSTSAVTFAKR